MKELLKQIEQTQKLPGWATLKKAQTLASIVIALRPLLSVEVGVFGGRSFLPIALAHKFIGKGAAIGVEPWSNDAAAEGYTGENREWWSKLDLQSIKKLFKENVNLLGVQNVTQIYECKSEDFIPPDGIGLLHLDGQHTDQAIREVKKFASKMLVGGLIVLDDIHWSNDGKTHVSTAAQWLLDNGFDELYRVFNKPQGGQDDWGVFRRIE